MATATTSTVDGSPSAVLAAVIQHRAAAEQAQLAVLLDALDWAMMHSPEFAPIDEWATVPGTGGEVSLSGEGAPRVLEFCIAEFAAAAGMTTESGHRLMGDAVEIRYRLPRLWRRVEAGQVPVWRARMIAVRTHSVSRVAAGWVDRQLAPCATRVGPAQIERTVNEALIRFDPGFVEDRVLGGSRYVRFDPTVDLDGGVMMEARLDVADALDLDQAVSREADLRARLGDDTELDVRRARGLGDLARRQLALELNETSTDGKPVVVAPRPAASLYFHISADPASAGTDGQSVNGQSGDVPVTLGNRSGSALSLDSLIDWLRLSGASVNVRPVIDLNSERQAKGYRPTSTQLEHVYLRDRACVFPYCNRPARPPGHRSGVDADHIGPYAKAEVAGKDPAGNTTTENLAALCRHHHRHKTHSAWSYSSPEPGVYIWTSPHGLSFVRTRQGTHRITRPPG